VVRRVAARAVAVVVGVAHAGFERLDPAFVELVFGVDLAAVSLSVVFRPEMVRTTSCRPA
jgi:hypothetical protein